MSLKIVKKFDNGGLIDESRFGDYVDDNISNYNLSKNDQLNLRKKVDSINSLLKNSQNKVTFNDDGSYSVSGPDAQSFQGSNNKINSNIFTGNLNIKDPGMLNNLAMKVYKDSMDSINSSTVDKDKVGMENLDNYIVRSEFNNNKNAYQRKLQSFKTDKERENYFMSFLPKMANDYISRSNTNSQFNYGDVNKANEILKLNKGDYKNWLNDNQGIDISALDFSAQKAAQEKADADAAAANNNNNVPANNGQSYQDVTSSFNIKNADSNWIRNVLSANNAKIYRNPNGSYFVLGSNGQPFNYGDNNQFSKYYRNYFYNKADENGNPVLFVGKANSDTLKSDQLAAKLFPNNNTGKELGISLTIPNYNNMTGYAEGVDALGRPSYTNKIVQVLNNNIERVYTKQPNGSYVVHEQYKGSGLPTGKKDYGVNLDIQGSGAAVERNINPLNVRWLKNISYNQAEANKITNSGLVYNYYRAKQLLDSYNSNGAYTKGFSKEDLNNRISPFLNKLVTEIRTNPESIKQYPLEMQRNIFGLLSKLTRKHLNGGVISKFQNGGMPTLNDNALNKPASSENYDDKKVEDMSTSDWIKLAGDVVLDAGMMIPIKPLQVASGLAKTGLDAGMDIYHGKNASDVLAGVGGNLAETGLSTVSLGGSLKTVNDLRKFAKVARKTKGMEEVVGKLDQIGDAINDVNGATKLKNIISDTSIAEPIRNALSEVSKLPVTKPILATLGAIGGIGSGGLSIFNALKNYGESGSLGAMDMSSLQGIANTAPGLAFGARAALDKSPKIFKGIINNISDKVIKQTGEPMVASVINGKPFLTNDSKALGFLKNGDMDNLNGRIAELYSKENMVNLPVEDVKNAGYIENPYKTYEENYGSTVSNKIKDIINSKTDNLNINQIKQPEAPNLEDWADKDYARSAYDVTNNFMDNTIVDGNKYNLNTKLFITKSDDKNLNNAKELIVNYANSKGYKNTPTSTILSNILQDKNAPDDVKNAVKNNFVFDESKIPTETPLSNQTPEDKKGILNKLRNVKISIRKGQLGMKVDYAISTPSIKYSNDKFNKNFLPYNTNQENSWSLANGKYTPEFINFRDSMSDDWFNNNINRINNNIKLSGSKLVVNNKPQLIKLLSDNKFGPVFNSVSKVYNDNNNIQPAKTVNNNIPTVSGTTDTLGNVTNGIFPSLKKFAKTNFGLADLGNLLTYVNTNGAISRAASAQEQAINNSIPHYQGLNKYNPKVYSPINSLASQGASAIIQQSGDLSKSTSDIDRARAISLTGFKNAQDTILKGDLASSDSLQKINDIINQNNQRVDQYNTEINNKNEEAVKSAAGKIGMIEANKEVSRNAALNGFVNTMIHNNAVNRYQSSLNNVYNLSTSKDYQDLQDKYNEAIDKNGAIYKGYLNSYNKNKLLDPTYNIPFESSQYFKQYQNYLGGLKDKKNDMDRQIANANAYSYLQSKNLLSYKKGSKIAYAKKLYDRYSKNAEDVKKGNLKINKDMKKAMLKIFKK